MEKEGFLEVKNILLYYQEIKAIKSDDSGTLVFLHDALGSTAQWKDFPKLLAEKTGLNAIVFDRQGYGQSGLSAKLRTKNYLHDEAHLLLPEFLKKLKIENPILFGHSDGGTIALLYASVFEPLAIVCEAAHILVENETIEGIQKTLEHKKLIVNKLKKYHGEKAEMLFEAWHETWLDPGFQDWNIEESLQDIKCPVLLLQGENDEYATLGHLQKIKKGIGENAQSVIIKNCGHIPHLETPEEILDNTAEFIRTTFQGQKL